MVARLAAERSWLLWLMMGLDETTLVESPVVDDWTAKDLLAHIAAWDEVMARRVELVLAGCEEEIAIYTGAEEDACNAAFHIERKNWTLAQAVATFQTARARFLAAVARLSDEEFDRQRSFTGGDASAREWMEWRARHDAAHAADLVAWRKTHGPAAAVGPGEVLLAALAAAREELAANADLVAREEKDALPVCGTWTLKDVLAHVADWEWVGVEGLRDMVSGRSPRVEHIGDIDAWNQAHYEARRDQPWEEVWVDFRAARDAFLEVVKGMGQANLSSRYSFPWGEKGTPYRWVAVYVSHDREHAEGLREALGG
jgi:hypothetical protein